jgi:hypothetical protein
MTRNYLTDRDQDRNGTAPWKIPRKMKKHGRKAILEKFFRSFSCKEKKRHVRRCAKLHWVPLFGFVMNPNTIWNENRLRRASKNKRTPFLFTLHYPDYQEEDFDADYDDFDNWGDDSDGHGFDCDCQDCTDDYHESNCGELPPHLGGGCSNAGSEYCDFECPFRDRVMNGEDDDE